jgi:hypothetical protein
MDRLSHRVEQGTSGGLLDSMVISGFSWVRHSREHQENQDLLLGYPGLAGAHQWSKDIRFSQVQKVGTPCDAKAREFAGLAGGAVPAEFAGLVRVWSRGLTAGQARYLMMASTLLRTWSFWQIRFT